MPFARFRHPVLSRRSETLRGNLFDHADVRQEQCEHKYEHHYTQQYSQHGFDESGKRVDSYVEVFLVDIGNLLGDLVQAAGLFAGNLVRPNPVW